MKYVSEKTNKVYDTVEDLEKAEAEFEAAEAKKKEAAAAKKAEACKVEDAFKALNAAKKDYNDVRADAKEAYAKAVAEAQRAYDAAINPAIEKLNAADKRYDDALAEFKKNHPEGFHLTLKDGDNVAEIRETRDHFDDATRSFLKTLLNF